MQSKLLHAVRWANVPKRLANAMIGHDHSPLWRMGFGVVIMAGGVAIAKSAHDMATFWQYTLDLVGYGIHGLGLTPVIETLLEVE